MVIAAKVAQTDFKFKGEISFFHMGHRYWITFTTITFKENLVKPTQHLSAHYTLNYL